jgi:KaiC/GvpD/RAD55 family RecA-like ATPase
VRGQGGLVAFYGWEYGPNVRPLLAPPQWLIDLLPSKNSPKIIGDSFKKLDFTAAMQSLKEGNRNETLFKLASSLRARGFELKEIYETLLPKAKEVGISEKELYTLSQSSCKYPAGQRPPAFEDTSLLETFEQFLQDEKPVEYLVPGIFAKRSIAFTAGLPGTCKTWTLIDLAIELARKDGGNWLGRFPVKHSKVLYIDQERDKSEAQRRFRKLIAAKGLQAKDFNESLTIKCRTTYRMNIQNSFEGFKRLLTELRPEVVIIDSFKTFHTLDITSNVNMQEVMENIKALKNEFGCTFIFVYHENNSAYDRTTSDGKKAPIDFSRMAGAAALKEVPETIMIVVKQDDKSSWLHHAKNSLGQKVAPVIVSVEDLDSNKTQVIAR